jgi:hypothetical protein
MAALAAFLPLAILGAGCGGVSSDREIARDQATTASCDWYQACGQIGPDASQKYQSRSSCETQVRAQWDSGWPVATCESKINQAQLSICLDAIHITECTNPIDILITLGSKCAQANVCSGA